MNLFTKIKLFLKLFPAMLVFMLGAGHSIVEARNLTNRTSILVFGFKYDPTLWTFLLTLFVTIAALVITIKILFKQVKAHKKDS